MDVQTEEHAVLKCTLTEHLRSRTNVDFNFIHSLCDLFNNDNITEICDLVANVLEFFT